MAINTSKVITGGLVAGLVMNIVDFVSNATFLKAPTEASMNALNPSLMQNMQHGGTIAGIVAIDFLVGILLVFTYAAVRPRFGAGPRSAMMAAFILWATGSCVVGYFFLMGMFTPAVYWLTFCEEFVSISLGAYVGGMMYKEEAAATAGAAATVA